MGTAVTGERLEELKNINSSLMYLQRAISDMAKKFWQEKEREAELCSISEF